MAGGGEPRAEIAHVPELTDAPAAAAQQPPAPGAAPWTTPALSHVPTPSWLSISGEVRTRLESRWGLGYRSDVSDSEQVRALNSLVQNEFGRLDLVLNNVGGTIPNAFLDTDVAYRGRAANYGQPNDPMVGDRIGGVNVFGGGLALYNSSGVLVGAIGVSGDTSCADHNIAWRTRHNLGLDYLATAGAGGSAGKSISIQSPARRAVRRPLRVSKRASAPAER